MDQPTREIIQRAGTYILGLKGQTLPVLDIARPTDMDGARNLAKVVSKLSPLVGNMIEFSVVSLLNGEDWEGKGIWKRQDPGFPDTIFEGDITPKPGFEIKAWFPFATEITARFKDSITSFEHDQTYVALIAWLPEHILHGKPLVIDVWLDSGRSLALARDLHYRDPPDYLVIEPEDTADRTSNLQQTNTNGHKFQGTPTELAKAERVVSSWGPKGLEYSSAPDYQKLLKELMGNFPYKLDTNFAKIDRIAHKRLEEFKEKVLGSTFRGRKVLEWSNNISESDSALQKILNFGD